MPADPSDKGVCIVCRQPIRRAESEDYFRGRMFHSCPEDCWRAVARKCAELSDAAGRAAIRAEFEEAF